MLHRRWTFGLLALSLLPILVATAQESPATEKTADQVFKNIVSFKGVPAKDLIPAMEFMAASLKAQCTYCHNPTDYSAETQQKDVTRNMISLQRDINDRHFKGRLEVTCMSCHNGREHPLATPVPDGTSMRHERFTTTLKADDVFKKHLTAVGQEPTSVALKGTLTSPTGEEGKEATGPAEFVQARGGRYSILSGMGTFGSDGRLVWHDGMLMTDEPAAFFDRLGRAWRGDSAFAGLEGLRLTGRDTIGKAKQLVVRGVRSSTGSTEELYFDEKTGLLSRMVNVTRSTIGSVVTTFDYTEYKPVKGVKVPMKIVTTFASGESWTLTFKSATVGEPVDEKLFSPPKSGSVRL